MPKEEGLFDAAKVDVFQRDVDGHFDGIGLVAYADHAVDVVQWRRIGGRFDEVCVRADRSHGVSGWREWLGSVFKCSKNNRLKDTRTEILPMSRSRRPNSVMQGTEKL